MANFLREHPVLFFHLFFLFILILSSSQSSSMTFSLSLQFYICSYLTGKAPGGAQHADALHHRSQLILPLGDTGAGEMILRM